MICFEQSSRIPYTVYANFCFDLNAFEAIPNYICFRTDLNNFAQESNILSVPVEILDTETFIPNTS